MSSWHRWIRYKWLLDLLNLLRSWKIVKASSLDERAHVHPLRLEGVGQQQRLLHLEVDELLVQAFEFRVLAVNDGLKLGVLSELHGLSRESTYLDLQLIVFFHQEIELIFQLV